MVNHCFFRIDLPCSVRILVVEDEDAIARGLRFNFEREGHQDPTSPRHLLSIRGTGYRFVCELTHETLDEPAGSVLLKHDAAFAA